MTALVQAARRDESALAYLRLLAPRRRLTFAETLRIAELQANRLLDWYQIDDPAVPTDVVACLPQIAVDYDLDMPVSGSSYWNGTAWIITLNASEPLLRRRFTLMHEFKHIVDHTTRQYLYGPPFDLAARGRAERAADYFAACLLMPKRWIKRAWATRTQSVSELANIFGVSPRAMRFRLNQLALADSPDRSRAPERLTGHGAVQRDVEIAA